MSKIIIPAGKGEILVQKSKNLVGLKATKSTNLSKTKFVKNKLLENLGGFEIVTLEKAGTNVDKKLDEVRKKRNIKVGTHVYFAEGSKKPIVPTGEIFIIFEENTNEEEQNIVIDEFKLKLVERRDKNRIIVETTKDSRNPLKVAEAMQKTSLVKLAEPDIDTLVDEYDFIKPDDNLLEHQWYFQNNGIVADVNRPLKKGADAKILDAWNRIGNMGDKSVTIAVIDNGFDLKHPDLKPNVHRPFDLWNNSSSLITGDTRFTHGTPCASIAVAASNGFGMVGVAPNAKFMPVSGTSFSLRATEQMFDYCVRHNADVISCSWGTTDPAFNLNPMKEEAIARAAREGRNGKGCVIVYAVGNDDKDFVSFYSAHPDVIAVAASTSQDKHASYSNRGREVTVCAPSNGDWPLIAARASWDPGISWKIGEEKYWYDGRSRGNNYKHFGGTSAACPMVAGICALILSVNPDLKASEVKDILKKTADKIGSPVEYFNGHSVKYGYGRVNADKAIAEALRRKDGASNVLEVTGGVASGRGIFRFNVARQEPTGYGVQIGAFAEYGNVLIQAEKLQKEFDEPIIVSINELNGKTVYKIVVGAFSRKTQAVSLQVKMKRSGVNGFIRAIKDLR